MIDTSVLWIRAEGALRAGRHADAQIYLRQLVQVVERIDFEYEEWLRAFADSLKASGHWGEAMACLAYLGARELPGPEVLQAQVPLARAGDPDALRTVPERTQWTRTMQRELIKGGKIRLIGKAEQESGARMLSLRPEGLILGGEAENAGLLNPGDPAGLPPGTNRIVFP